MRADELVDIRLRIDIGGTFHGVEHVKRGQVVTVPLSDAARYVRQGYAETALSGPIGNPYEYRG